MTSLSLPALRAVLRLVLRWIRGNRGASLALVVMIAVPVAAATLTSVLMDTGRGSPRRAIEHSIGRAAAGITDAGYGDVPVLQSVDTSQVRPAPPGAGDGPRPEAVPRPELPEGATVLSLTRSLVRARAGETELATQFQELDYTHPLARGMVETTAGRAPRGPAEVAASPAFLRRAGIGVGHTVRVPEAGRSFLVVGQARPSRDHGEVVLFAQPGALYDHLVATAPASERQRLDFRSWLVDRDIDWAGVLRANQRGLVVLSRKAVLDPPPPERVALPNAPPEAVRTFHDLLLDDLTGGRDRTHSTGERLGMLVAGIAVLEVVLLGGAMFAVGVRMGRRQLGSLAANGASGPQLALLLLTWGLVLGLVGAVVGILLGLGGAAGLLELVGHYDLPQTWRLRIRAGDVLWPLLLGLGAGMAAALVPALRVARDRAALALAGRRSERRPSRLPRTAGLVLLAAGAAVALAAAFLLDGPALAPVATVLITIGLFLCFPSIVGRIAALAPALPVSVRIALREVGRHRARSAPAIAAVMVVVIGTIAVDTLDATRSAYVSGRYWPTLPGRHAAVLVDDVSTRPAQWDQLRATLAHALPARSVAEVTALPGAWDACGPTACPTTVEVAMSPAAGCGPDWTTREQWLPPGGPDCVHHRRLLGTVLVGDAELLRRVSGVTAPEAVAALGRGEAVVLDSRYVQDGQVTFAVTTPQGNHRVAMRATAVNSEVGSTLVVLPEEAADHLGVPGYLRALDLELDRRLSTYEQDRVTAMARAAGLTSYVENDGTGQASLFALLLLVCTVLLSTTAAVTATLLSLIDTRRHSTMLATVGATLRTRRTLAVAQSLIITVLGSALGVLVGILPATLISAQAARRLWREGPVALPFQLVIPWPVLAFVLLAVPATAALIALASVRRNLPIPRRHT